MKHLKTPFSGWYAKDEQTSCWLWTGKLAPTGYGRKTVAYRRIGAHCWSWELHNGPIPRGLIVMHICDVKHCVNPAHLKLGTQAENVQDAVKKGRHSSVHQVHLVTCRSGRHPWISENIYTDPKGRKACLVCIQRRRDIRKKGKHHVL